MGRPGVRRVVAPRWAVTALAASSLVLVAVASLDGHPLLQTAPAGEPGIVPVSPPAPTAHEVTPTTPVPPTPRDDAVLPTWLSLPTVALVLALVAVLVAALVWLLRARSRRPLAPHRPTAVPESAGLDLEGLMTVDDAAQQTARLREGSPRNGVVATWLELERLVAERGIPRRPSETSSELVVRVLGHAAVPQESLADLNALFREARFSAHELTEEHRRRAAADLDAVHAALGVGTGRPTDRGKAQP